MDCSGCVLTLKEHCDSLRGILSVEASAMTGVAHVLFEPETVSEEEIVDHIRLLGHTVAVMVDSVSVVFQVIFFSMKTLYLLFN